MKCGDCDKEAVGFFKKEITLNPDFPENGIEVYIGICETHLKEIKKLARRF